MKINTTLLNIKHCILLASYWGIICVLCGGFSAVFLSNRGFSNTEIGFAVGAGNLLGVVLQTVVAAYADRSKKVSLHFLNTILAVMIGIGFLALYFISHLVLAVGIIFVFTYTVIQIVMPLTNAVSMYYSNRGVKVQFGIARGIGSAFYALLAKLLGEMIERKGTNILLLVGIVLVLVFIIAILSMPVLKDVKSIKEKEESQSLSTNSQKESFLYFIKKYDRFVFVLAGVMFTFTFHYLSNTYLKNIVESIGGSEGELGTALSLAAIVELPIMACFPLISKKISNRRLLIISGIFFLIKSVGYFVIKDMNQMYIVQLLQMGCYGIYIPASVHYVNDLMEEKDTVKGQALMVAASSLGGFIASLSGGAIIDNFGLRTMLVIQILVAAIGALLFFFASDNKKA